jgi:hypothetical protein
MDTSKLFGGGERPIEGGEPAIEGANPAFLSAGTSGGGNTGSDSGGTAADGFDPAIHVGRDSLNLDGTFRRKRGRKSNSGNSASTGGRTKAQNNASVEGLTRILSILHIGLAAATKTPELALEDSEAENLAKATATVLTEFDIRPDPKIEAVIGLVTAASLIYGPRVYLITERKKQEALDRQKEQ